MIIKQNSRKIKSGRLDKRLVLQEKTETDTKTGSYKENWSTILTVWANIKHDKQVENIQAKRINNILTASIEIRYRDDINTNCRATWNGNTYYFTSVINVNNENRILLINAEVKAYESN